MEFRDFKEAVNEQFTDMVTGSVFVTDVTKDDLWETYLSSFPAGTNPIYRERREHDCQCCKQFIRACGNIVSINDNLELESIWDIEIGGHYQVVADALSALVKGRAINDIFLHYQKKLGTDFNHQEMEDGSIQKWEHFYFVLPFKLVNHDDIGTVLSKAKANTQVFGRGLKEISDVAIEMVLELIDQGSIYRGEEMRPAVASFQKVHEFQASVVLTESQRKNFIWKYANEPGARIKNTAIGTLLIDISEGLNLDKAVGRFESKVAPENYKRPSALITKGMIKKAQDKITELGYLDSLKRRNATLDDLTINNVLFANRDTKKAMNVFDEMIEETAVDLKRLDKIEEVDINTFIATVLPQAKVIEVLFENKHENNLMSLVAPVDPDAPGMFKWGNNFSWAYSGEVADSLKDQVKSLGGKVDGVARFSLIWNQKGTDQGIDFDAHCKEPKGGRHIYFDNQGTTHPSTGRLDVDNTHPGDNPGIENIAYTNLQKIKDGKHVFQVHNYSRQTSKEGFVAELEINGEVHVFEHPRPLKGREYVTVAEVNYDKAAGKFEILKSLASTSTPRPLWGLTTVQFQKVSMIMNSPNHWDGEETGNKHWFFILEGCNSGNPVRGFFNEFLKEGLTEHRKVFEVLGSKMKTTPEGQLSGLGFSSTKRASLVCKVIGSFSRIIKVKF